MAWPLAAQAQQPAIPVVGYLDGSGLSRWFEAFQHGMSDLGYVHGRTIVIELRDAAGQAKRLPELAAELVRLQPKVIVASGSPAAIAGAKCHRDDSHRVHFCHRPNWPWACRKSRTPRWQRHGTV